MEFSSEKPKFPSNSSNIKYLRRKEVDLGPPSQTLFQNTLSLLNIFPENGYHTTARICSNVLTLLH